MQCYRETLGAGLEEAECIWEIGNRVSDIDKGEASPGKRFSSGTDLEF